MAQTGCCRYYVSLILLSAEILKKREYLGDNNIVDFRLRRGYQSATANKPVAAV